MEIFAVPFLLAIAQMHVHATTVSTTDEAKYRIQFYRPSVSVPEEPLSLEDFVNHACSACYINLPNQTFANEKQLYKYNNTSGYLLDGSGTEYASGSMYKDSNSKLYQSLKENYISFWTDCCQSAENCSEAMGSYTDETSKCMPVWDGLKCWLDPKENEQSCPSFYEGYITEKPSLCQRTVRKFCNASKWSHTVNFCPPFEFYRWQSNDSLAVDNKCCRTELSLSLSYKSFKLYTCARCYVYMLPPDALRFDLRYTGSCLVNTTTGNCYYADLEEDTTAIESSLGSQHTITRWKNCCLKAAECCDSMLTIKPHTDLGNFCPPNWDGYTCFGYTKAGATAREDCPHYIFSETANRPCVGQSTKVCEKNGNWFFNYSSSREREFTDYACNAEGVLTEEEYSVALYSVSVIFLCIALIPFFYYRQLHVHRITVHKNLFISLALTCFFIIIHKRVVTLDAYYKFPDLASSVKRLNGPGCKILEVLWKYFESTSHFWMLCEGFYLHKLITSAFSEQKNLKLFYVIGWGIPILPVLIYAIVKKVTDDNECWVENPSLGWIVSAPSLLCLSLNFLFLCNIIRVLITKLRSVQSNEPSYFRKTVRATLILLPLLGVHQLLISVNLQYPVTCLSRHRYMMFKNTVLSLEGFIISCLFCYMNGEVLFLLKRSYQRFRARHSLSNTDPRRRSRFSVSTQVSSVADGGGHSATTQA